jgi:peroxiredoxin/glutaredoxin
MQHRQIGDRVPEVTFRTRTETGWRDLTSEELFRGRTVVVFSLPGAFTPTCSTNQLPGYNRLAPVFKANGVDEIVCVSVNDAFVMREWQATQDAGNITMIPDGNGEFTAGMGMLVDKQELGFGKRSWRYSMLVRDGVIERLFVEPQKPGDPYEVSDPETMLASINPGARIPDSVMVLSRKGCGHCERARRALTAAGYLFDEIEMPEIQKLYALSGRKTTPQVFVNGAHIGGADELEDWLAARAPAPAAAA